MEIPDSIRTRISRSKLQNNHYYLLLTGTLIKYADDTAGAAQRRASFEEVEIKINKIT